MLNCFTRDLLFCLLHCFLVSFTSAMRPLQVRASPSVWRRENLPFRFSREPNQGQVNRPQHRKSHGQFNLMFFFMFIVHSLAVLAGKGKCTTFESRIDKDLT